MEQRIALVTGSSRGIGRETAFRLAENLSGIAVHYKSNRKAADEVVKGIKKLGKSSRPFRADLTKEDGATDLIRKVKKHFTRLDVLVNNFGPFIVKPWEEVETAEWEWMFRANFLSALHCIRAALPGMRARGWGRIINIGYHRVEQLAAFSRITPYAVAKTALLILTRSVAASEAKSGITVNMVSPGLIEGGVLPGKKELPAELIGAKKDVAEAAAFLASDEAGRITGTNLIVAGGWKL